VHREVVNLHPEIKLLRALEGGRLSVRRRNAGANLGGTDDEVSGTDVFGGYRFHVIGEDERRSREAVVRKIGDQDSLAPGSNAIAVDVFHHNVETIAARAERNRFPVNL